MRKMTKDEIRKVACDFRVKCAHFGLIYDDGALDLPRIFEHIYFIERGWTAKVVEESDLEGKLGLTRPSLKEILLPEHVYNGMCLREPEHCFTFAHELGHLKLHSDLCFARTPPPGEFAMINFETEADTFAQELVGFESPAFSSVMAQVQAVMKKAMK